MRDVWKFPILCREYRRHRAAGYLKIVGDFARWHDRIVLGCDDTAKSEFANAR
jgi:hypothetical protein